MLEGARGALCGGCLAARRSRAPAGAALRELLLRLADPEEFPEVQQLQLEVCWECEAALRSMAAFSSRVRKSMRILCDYLKGVSGDQNYLDLARRCSSSLRQTPVECTAFPDSTLPTTGDPTEPSVCALNSDNENSKETDVKLEDDMAASPGGSVKEETFGDLEAAVVVRRRSRKVKKTSRKQTVRDRWKRSEGIKIFQTLIGFPAHSLNSRRPPSERACFPASSLPTIGRATEPSVCPLTSETNGEETHIKTEDPDLVEAAPQSPGLQMDLDDVPLARQRSKKLKKKSSRKQIERERWKSAEMEKLKQASQFARARYATVQVSEEQLQAWRCEDGRCERYQQLPHKCASCLVAYHFHDQLVWHNAKKHHESLGPAACDVCASRFPTECEMHAHRALHYVRYECLHCDYLTRDNREMDRHYAMEHSGAQYACKLCDAVFKTASHLRYHKDDKHGSRWPCKYCDKTFRLRNNMYAHMLIHKKLPEAPCPVCHKSMRNKYALKIHLKIHEEAKRAYCCQPCGTQYKTKTGYKNHLNTSMKHLTPDKLKYGCEECGRRFVTEKRLRRHHASVHLKKSEFECDKCSKSYSTKLALKNHILQKHDVSYQGPVRDKICDICGKGFAVIGILKSHMRTHTGERPFQCELCPSAFSHRAALYTHNRLVHLKLKRKRSSKKKPQEIAYGLDPVYI